MSSAYKPAGYNSASPYLIVDGAAATIEFLTNAFDAIEIRRFPAPDDPKRLMHAEIRLDDSVIMLGDCSPDWPQVPAHVHVYVADVDASYQRALAAGAQSVQEPVQKGDDDKRGGVLDAGGTTWWLATKMT